MGTHRVTRQGFSLIELLIVVVIIGIIGAIAVPNLLASRRAANSGSQIDGSILHSGTQELAFKTNASSSANASTSLAPGSNTLGAKLSSKVKKSAPGGQAKAVNSIGSPQPFEALGVVFSSSIGQATTVHILNTGSSEDAVTLTFRDNFGTKLYELTSTVKVGEGIDLDTSGIAALTGTSGYFQVAGGNNARHLIQAEVKYTSDFQVGPILPVNVQPIPNAYSSAVGAFFTSMTDKSTTIHVVNAGSAEDTITLSFCDSAGIKLYDTTWTLRAGDGWDLDTQKVPSLDGKSGYFRIVGGNNARHLIQAEVKYWKEAQVGAILPITVRPLSQ